MYWEALITDLPLIQYKIRKMSFSASYQTVKFEGTILSINKQ
jgi:hypothetical protein